MAKVLTLGTGAPVFLCIPPRTYISSNGRECKNVETDQGNDSDFQSSMSEVPSGKTKLLPDKTVWQKDGKNGKKI